MIKADTPNLWEIRSRTDHATAVAILVTALIHLSRLVNLPKESNLDVDYQIGEIANDIVEEYGYLKPEEVKYLLKQAVRENKIFGRLDYPVVMSWFEDYDRKRTEICIDISNQQETQAANAPADCEGITFEQYVERLREQAQAGSKEAQSQLADIEQIRKAPGKSKADEHSENLAFFKWKAAYLNGKRTKEKN